MVTDVCVAQASDNVSHLSLLHSKEAGVKGGIFLVEHGVKIDDTPVLGGLDTFPTLLLGSGAAASKGGTIRKNTNPK